MTIRRLIPKQLGELLIERGLLERSQLEEALRIQKDRVGVLIGDIMVELGYVKEEDITQALSAQYGFPFLPLANYEIDPDVIKVIPERVARQYLVVPIDKLGKNLTVVMSNPSNEQAINDIELLTGCTVQAFVSTSTDITNAIDRYYKKK